MKRLIITLPVLFFIFISFNTFSQSTQTIPDYFTVAFYNLENLFDTIDDPKTNDSEFLPEGKKMWIGHRYKNKLKNKGRVIAAIDSTNMPAIIGVSEVENLGVLQDLVNSEYLKNTKYDIVHYDSPDPRGIDVGLLYRPDVFSLISYKAVPVYYDSVFMKKRTREIMYVKGLAANADTLHIFINHWKSRSGGMKETEPKRVRYARVLREVIDSIFNVNPEANIIAMGDFNDDPDNISVKDHLQAMKPVKSPVGNHLYNMMKPLKAQGKGTHFFRGEWNILDQIIISGALLGGKGNLYSDAEGAQIFNPLWLTRLYKATGDMIPIPTFEGSTYFGGYSDHFAVYIKIKLKQ